MGDEQSRVAAKPPVLQSENVCGLPELRKHLDESGDAMYVCVPPASLSALLDVAEAAKGALKYARSVDLHAAVIQGGYPALDAALAVLSTESEPVQGLGDPHRRA